MHRVRVCLAMYETQRIFKSPWHDDVLGQLNAEIVLDMRRTLSRLLRPDIPYRTLRNIRDCMAG